MTGFQVPPAELEGVLLTCPLVADCAVIGVWSEAQATELPRAYGSFPHHLLRPTELMIHHGTVVPEAKYAKDQGLEQKIIDYVQSKVAPHKRLRGGVVLIEVIPKSCVSCLRFFPFSSGRKLTRFDRVVQTFWKNSEEGPPSPCGQGR